jgi:CRP/FNR family transcriptional regulator, anaerobic regulatory protein
MPTVTAQIKSSCSNCGLRELCLPIGLSADEFKRLDQLVYARRKIGRGEDLYRAGNAFSAIYAVRSGFFKNDLVYQDGRGQVIGFHMEGDILGIDGIGTDRYACNAVALEDSEVCVIPFSRLEEIAHGVRSLQRQFHQVMSREMVRNHDVMLLLGARAEVRLAAFLLNLSRRLKARGYSASQFTLRMTREEIGSFLWLKLETVSRMFSKFQQENLITVVQRHIRILDAAGLGNIVRPPGGEQRHAAGTGLSKRRLPLNGRPEPAVSSALVPCA